MRAWGWRRGIVAALGVLLATPCAFADEGGKEAAVRAAFLFRLAFFVSWPDSAFGASHSPVQICLAPGNDELARTLAEQTATRTVQERPVAVSTLSLDASDADTAASCHILYLGNTGLPASLPGLGHTVIVVDSLVQLDRAGALALVREETAGEARLVFYARRDRLQKASFSLSSKLLQLLRFQEGRS